MIVALACSSLGTAHAQAYTLTDTGLVYAAGVDVGKVVGRDAGQIAHLWDNGVAISLGTLPGGVSSSANAVNNGGAVVGNADLGRLNEVHGFYWSGGVMVDLGTLGGRHSDAKDINDAGVLVGGSWTLGDTWYRGFVGTPGRLRELPSFGGTYTSAEAINESNVVVGYSDYVTITSRRAFMYDGGVLTDLGSLGGISGASDINEAGQISGYSQDPTGSLHAVRWNPDILGGPPRMIDLGVPNGAGTSQAYAINDAGVVVGGSSGLNGEHAVIFRPGGAVYLEDLVGSTPLQLVRAEDIDDAGDIVGLAFDPGTRAFRGFYAVQNPLVATGPSPGSAGGLDRFVVTGANPGSTVYVAYGTQAGTTDLSAWCDGEGLDVQGAQVAATAVANANGVAVPSFQVPIAASGRTVRFQVVEPDSCRVSALVVHAYP